MSYTSKQKAAYAKLCAAQREHKAVTAAPIRRTTTYTRKSTPIRRAPTGRPAVKRVIKSQSTHRKQLTGRGAYSLHKTPKHERGIGESIGRGVGGFVGKGIQALVKHITGFGEYHIDNNSLMAGGLSPPEIVNSSDNGGFIIRHREYLKDIQCSTGFVNEVIPINPGLTSSFPWLATVADGFEQYRLRGMVFEFNSLSSDAVLSSSTSSALGSVMMATSYNSLNPPFQNKAEMENYEFANSRKPSLSFMHPVECKDSLTSTDLKYIRNGPIVVSTNGDARLYDMGNFQIATEGMQSATGVCGELWCTYEIEMYKPKYNPFTNSLAADHITGANASNTNPFGTTYFPPTSTSNLGGRLDGNLNRYTFPPSFGGGSYQFIITWTGTAQPVAISYPSLLATPNTTFITIQSGASSIISYNPQATIAAVNSMCIIFVVQITAPGAYIQWNNTGASLPLAPSLDFKVSSFPVTLIDEIQAKKKYVEMHTKVLTYKHSVVREDEQQYDIIDSETPESEEQSEDSESSVEQVPALLERKRKPHHPKK